MKKIIALALSVLVVAGVFAGCAGGGKTTKEIKKADTYAQEVQAYGVWDSETEQAMPQTVVHKLMLDHFNAPLPEGKTAKKAILLGYDGMRADGIEHVKDDENSAIMYIKSKGGLYHTFSGGVAGVNEQATSTSPSWLAMLTGGWGDYNGIKDNGGEKKPEAETYLTTLAKQGYTASFTTSWREHTGLTYRPDTVAAIENGYPMEFTHQIDDNGTYYQVLKYVAKPASVEKTTLDPDVIFFTFEHPDHAGHGSGFGSQNPNYIDAIHEADHFGMEIIKTIEARDTYEQEDWLIIIDADHGGTITNHGAQSPFERMTWLASNKPIEITDEYLNYAVK